MNFIILFFSLFFLNENASLETQIYNYLQTAFSSYSRYDFEIIKYPESSKDISLSADGSFNRKGNLVYLPVEAVIKGRSVKSFIIIKVDLYQNIFVAKNRIEKDKILNESDLIKKEINIADLKGNPVANLDFINGYRTKRIIEPGEILFEEWIEKIPVVNPGDQLNANLVSGSVVINIEVISRDKGNEGDIIKVVTDNKKILDAEIIDSKNVLIIN